MPTQVKILIVDDEKMNREVLVALLKPHYKIMVVKNGRQALKAAARLDQQPDLILLDIMMPGMDGYEVCRCLKADELTRQIPVIFITALGDVEDESRGLQLGAVDYITKPVSLPIVLARVKTHLQLRKMQRLLEEKNQALQEVARLRDDVEHILRHDLKSPLNAIVTAPTLFSNKHLFTDEDKLLLTIIEQAGHKMLKMINNSLDLYKMETGSYILQAQKTDLIEIIKNVLREINTSQIAVTKKAVLSTGNNIVKPGDTFYAMVEPMLCYPMFSNLLLNAFEASPEGATVQIALDTEPDSCQITVTITNRGTVPDSIRDRFFAKYVTWGKSNGTGLGTYSAMLCAKVHNGSIKMESLPEEQTRVSVTLPGVPI
jgi:DNA-binding response OmpR family regulator